MEKKKVKELVKKLRQLKTEELLYLLRIEKEEPIENMFKEKVITEAIYNTDDYLENNKDDIVHKTSEHIFDLITDNRIAFKTDSEKMEVINCVGDILKDNYPELYNSLIDNENYISSISGLLNDIDQCLRDDYDIEIKSDEVSSNKFYCVKGINYEYNPNTDNYVEEEYI